MPASNRTGNCLACVISPDGQWLAYWTGSAGNPQTFNPSGPFDLQLNLLHIPDGATAKVAGLLSPDYPDNFQGERRGTKSLPEFSGQDVSSIANGLKTTFLWGIESAAWSPDGRFLAFAGEMDGPSSDLYVYDMAKGPSCAFRAAARTSYPPAGPAIVWSPDGKWIVYTSAYLAGEGMTVTSMPRIRTVPDLGIIRKASRACRVGFPIPSSSFNRERTGLENTGWKAGTWIRAAQP